MSPGPGVQPAVRAMAAAASVATRAWLARALVVLLVAGSLGVFAGGTARAASEAGPGPGLEVSLLTFGPGEIYWERFGHNAIVIRDPATGEATSYNYGIFDFEEDDFFVNFLRGRMSYQIAADSPQNDIDYYASTGRSVTLQTLRFTPAQAQALKQALDTNLLPENRHYRYDYFTSNCSTKVRDALDTALGGSLRLQMTSPSRGFTYRLLADALTSPDPLLMGVIDIGLGPFADQRLSFWKDSFVPMQLMAHLRDAQVSGADGQPVPLVIDEQVLVKSRLPAPPVLPPDLRWPFFGIGVAFAALLLFLSAQRQRRWARLGLSGAALVFSLACGIFGMIMLGLWVFTEHQSAWHNENLLVFSPLCLLLLPAWWRSARPSWSPSAATCWIAGSIALLASFALFSKVLSSFVQANLPWILLLLPAHLVLFHAVMTRRDTP